MIRRISIRWRMTLWNTAAFAVVLAGFGVLVFWQLRQTHYDQVDRVLMARYREVAADPQVAEAPRERFAYWMRQPAEHVDLAGVVLDPAGETVARAEKLGPDVPPLRADIVTNQPQFDTVRSPSLGRVRRMQSHIPTSLGPHTLALFAELEHVDEELELVVRSLMFTIPLTLLAAAALAYLLACTSLAPVEQLRRLADEITAERLDRRLPVPNPADELGLLAQTINSMIARLERSFEEVRRFTADASHELRTPIAVIRSEAEMGMDAARDLPTARLRFASILEECGRLAAATSQLLTLSREDAGVTRTARAAVRLEPLLQDAVDSLRPLAAAKRQQLILDVSHPATVLADPERLRQVFHNLIDNAIKYTPPEGQIAVSLTRHNGGVSITVRDTGIGIPAEHLPHIFDRFYRVQKGGDSDSGGAGLGLSIVHSIVTSLGGRVTADSHPGQGTSIHVLLPSEGQHETQSDRRT
ncbi:MAG: sensor histidine kinase [Pirellulaceae bacterium]